MQKAMSQFIKDTCISKKKQQKVLNWQDKTGCQKYNVSVTAIEELMPANCLILISTKLKKSRLIKSQQNKTGCQKNNVSVTAIAKLMPANFQY